MIFYAKKDVIGVIVAVYCLFLAVWSDDGYGRPKPNDENGRKRISSENMYLTENTADEKTAAAAAGVE